MSKPSPQLPSPSKEAISESSASPLLSIRLTQITQDSIEDDEPEAASDDHATEYHSFSDSDSDSDSEDDDDTSMTEEERRLERETRAAERQLVLEAAGIVVVAATRGETRPPPPPPPRVLRPSTPMAGERPKQQHRPPPAPPTPTPAHHDKPLPPIRTVDDAYERYETFKKQASRASVSSFDQLLLPPASPVISSPSRESHNHDRERERARDSGGAVGPSSYGSRITQLLARSRTPEPPRIVPTISAPILSASSSTASGTLGTPVREESAAFGSVSWA